ncbi:MAG: tetratricopeptide repeat protein [Verrucomicrobiales bacterium]
MKPLSIAEFAQYRFVRDAEGGVVALPSQGADEKTQLVLDCESWGLARLHLFAGAALDADKREAFEEEMKRIAAMRSRSLVRVASWGRDADDLFCASEMRDGEPLPAYLERASVPLAVAGEWIVQLFALLESEDELSASFRRFTTLNYQVIVDRQGIVRPVFSEFYGWTGPGARGQEHSLDWYQAQLFCSLIAGVPVRTFHHGSLPKNFEDLEEDIRSTVLASLEEDSGETYENLKAAMERLAEATDGDGEKAPLPRMALREWLRADLEESYDGPAEYALPPEVDPSDEPYAVVSRLRGGPANIQVLPGPGSIPRDGWLRQHHDATRRPGRGMVNQLRVNYTEDRNSVTLVGEESVEGVDLAALLGEIGPLGEAETRLVAAKVASAVDVLENHVASCSVWWLPPENVFVLTGSRSLSGSAKLTERKGAAAWEGYPLKFRLHQTTATLRDGVDLPAAVRQLAREPCGKHKAVRRSAVALPLIWRLLAGSRFRWEEPVTRPTGVSAEIGDLLEEYRLALNESPEALETDLFEAFAATAAPSAVESPPVVDTEAKEAAAMEEALEATLFDGEIDMAVTPEKESRGIETPVPVDEPQPATPEGEAPGIEGPEPATPETESGAPKKKGGFLNFWFWAALAGVVAAAVAGFWLSGWNERHGVYEAEPNIAFPETDYRSPAELTGDEVLAEIGEFLLEQGDPKHLKLLHLVEVFDFEANRVAVENALRAAAEDGNARAARLAGQLARTRGESPGNFRSWLLEAAEMGDAEAQYLYADSVLSDGAPEDVRTRAIELAGRAAGEGHAEAFELWAVWTREDDGELAFRAMESSARQGNVGAVYQLGLFRANGIGVDADPAGAAESFRKAAELGDPRAMYWFGRCLEVGHGVESAFTEAQRWMKNAASLGHEAAIEWCREREIAVPGAAEERG